MHKRFLTLLVFSLITFYQFGCTLPEVKDISPPIVRISYPYNNSVLSGMVIIRVEAFDESEIRSVWYYLDGELMASAASKNPRFQLDVTPYADEQIHVLSASAVDQDGNNGASEQVFVTISKTPDIIPPEVRLVNPINGQVVEQTVTVSAQARDNRIVREVAFFINGDSVSTVPVYPYNYTWDVRNLSDSTRHSVYAKAFDGSGNWTLSEVISVTVFPRSADTTPPTIVLLYPLAGSTVTGITDVIVDAFDNVVVSRVEFYVDGELQFVDTSPPWKYQWDTTPWADGGNHTMYFKAVDSSGNVGNNGPVSFVVQ